MAPIVRKMPRPGGVCRARQSCRPLDGSKAAISDCPPMTMSPCSFNSPNEARSILCDITRRSLAVAGVQENQIVTIGDCDRVSIGKQKIGDALVGAFVTPQDFAGVDVDRADAIRAALDHLTIFDSRELSAGAHVENIASDDHLRCESEIFRFPLGVAGSS